MSSAIPSNPAGPRPTPLVPLDRPKRPPPALPLSLTSFVGRERESAAITAALRGDGVRLLTLTGPGGVGKTRLALRVAAEMADEFSDGVWLVPLAPVRDPGLVAATVAETIGVREVGNRPLLVGLQAFLRDKRALLMLDNFEHVLAAAPLLADLLAACPRLTVLVTSRERLCLSGEHDVLVPPLSLSRGGRRREAEGGRTDNELSPASEAACLFVERARAARDDVAPTPDNAATVANICHRLDGLPLAIELAAAQTRLLSPPALLARLERRLPLLTGGPRDQPSRLQTMRDAIAWSHDLLDADERALFRRLAVFVGGCSLEAVEWVMGDHPSPVVFGLIASLVDKSLLRSLPPDGSPDGGPPRFAMLETIREYALEQLAASGEAEAVGRRHADYFLALAKRSAPQLLGEPGQLWWLSVLDEELPNIRAALAWLNDTGEATRAAEVTVALWRFLHIRDHFVEGLAWCERALRHGDRLPVALRAKVLAVRGLFEYLQTAPDRALATLDEAVRWALEAQDADAMALAHVVRATIRVNTGDLGGGGADADVGLANCTGLDQRWYATAALWVHGLGRFDAGDVSDAEATFARVSASASAMGDHYGVGEVAVGLGQFALARRDHDLALSRYRRALACGRLLDADFLIADAVEGLAVVLVNRGDGERAARLFGAMDALRARIGSVRIPPREALVVPAIASLSELLGPDAMAAAWQAGRVLPTEEACAEAEAASALPSEAGAGEAPLTPREMEVLRLLAEGHSNKEIAARLDVAPRTAGNHVASILAKLDVDSRTAAAAYAIRRHLL